MTQTAVSAREGREETRLEKLDRNTIELLNELRVAATGILFRHGEKRYLIAVANRLAIASMGFLAAGFAGILILLSEFVVGGSAPVVVGIVAVLGIGGLWFAVPLVRRAR